MFPYMPSGTQTDALSGEALPHHSLGSQLAIFVSCMATLLHLLGPRLNNPTRHP